MPATPAPVISTPGYEALTSGIGLWVDSQRALLRVEGARADRMLDGLLSADLSALRPGERALSFVLTAKGRPVALPMVIRLEDAVLLDVTLAALADLLRHFSTYLPPRFASVTVIEGARKVSLLGPDAGKAVDSVSAGDHLWMQRAPEEGGGVDVYLIDRVEEGLRSLDSAVRSIGGRACSPADYEVWRIERGLPRFGVDVTEDNLPQETGLAERAVSFEKGCYTGQEVVARIHYRGHVNRHLRGIRQASGAPTSPIPSGTPLTRDGRVVGTVTSSCASPRFGSIALGYVRREVSAGEEIRSEFDPEIPFLVGELPFTIT
ncbi:MAG: glycine cleavage T C-terminal barrel domain-containing protein [Candidatus Palauibacterales bacterium]|nr:glycine cleavage T C-terminal barrel domain-containing protein [Candidatus Palauibacterales bacterium]